jgi:all-trans-retinol dehydrogenase (NAD+)
LINNAGVGCPHPLLDVTEETIRRTFDVNLISHFLITKEFLPALVKANHGHVVTIASLASFLSISPTITYSCTKAGAMAFHEGLANELIVRYDAPKVRTT